MNKETRLELEDSFFNMMEKMSDGNPGAITAMISMVDKEEDIDPDSALVPVGTIFFMDTFNIYGSRIWMLYKDVCKENINATIGLIRACQMGLLYEEELNHAIDNYGKGIDVKEILERLKEELPNFDIGDLNEFRTD